MDALDDGGARHEIPIYAIARAALQRIGWHFNHQA